METTHHSEETGCQVTTATDDPEALKSSKSNCRELGVYRQISPVLYTLRLFGINMHSEFKYPCHTFGVANFVYTTVVLLFVVANACRLMMVRLKNDITEMQVLSNIQNIIWMVQNVGHYTVFFVNFLIGSRFCAFMVSYQQYADEYTGGIISIKRIAYKSVAVYLCVILLNVAFEAYYIYGYDIYNAMVHWPIQNNSNFKILMQLIYMIFMIHISAMWFGITLITSFISICLVHEYKVINNDVLQLSPSVFLQRLEHFRHRHYKVGNLTKLFDKFVSFQFAIDVSFDFILCSLQLYGLIWDQSIKTDSGLTIIYTIWVTIPITKVLIEFLCAGILNDTVSNWNMFIHYTETDHNNCYWQHETCYSWQKNDHKNS